MKNKRTLWIIGIIVLIIVIVSIYSFLDVNKSKDKTEQIPGENEIRLEESVEAMQNTETDRNWRAYRLKDIKTGRLFSINEFNGPVLLQSFAVWCPKCLQQQQELKRLIAENKDVVALSVDTDENENEAKVIEHLGKYGFEWYFVVSPSEMTQSLINEFGLGIIHAPSANVILICPGGKTTLLRSGIKSFIELKSEIEKC